MRLAGYVSRERCMSFLWLTWFLWHTEKCTFSQAFVPFKGCFEKVEEWLDDNKHLLGTIGMVILVVQVGVRNCSFLLCGFASVQFILPPVFFLLCVSSHLFVSGCLATSKKKRKKKKCASSGLCATIIYSTWGLCSAGFLGTHTREISLEMLKSLSSAP